ALLFTVKETAPLTLVILVLTAAAAGWRSPERWRDFVPGRREAAWALLLCLGIYVLCYTTFFTNPAGLADSVRAFLPWAEKGVGVQGTGHEKPWPYFLKLLAGFEATTV